MSLNISKENNGILVDGIDGWHCPILFEIDHDCNGDPEICEAHCVVNEDGMQLEVDIANFRGMEEVIAKHLNS